MITGIGSLPHTDAAAAVDLVLEYCPQAPFWPQLPKTGAREGMCAQFSEHLPCIRMKDNDLVFDGASQDDELEKFYSRVIEEDVEYFRISREYAAGLYAFYRRLKENCPAQVEFIKCHVTGPFTYAAGLKDASGKALLHDPVFMQVLIKALAMKARWQIKFFEKFAKKTIVFIDEPYLAAFGSAFSALSRAEAVKGLAEIAQAIKLSGAKVGIHCCGNTDWSIFTDTGSIDIINFDAFGYWEKLLIYADKLKDYFARGGLLCWGIVPTQEFSGRESAEILVKTIEQAVAAFAKKGIPSETVLDNMMLSPACGLGTLTTEKAEQIFSLLSKISARLKA